MVLAAAKKEMIWRFLNSAVLRGLLLVIPILFSAAIKSVTEGDFDRAVLMALISMLVYVLFRLSEGVNAYTWHKLYNKMYLTYTSIGLKYTNNNSIFSLSRIAPGEYINIMNNDVSVICDFYCNLSTRVIRVFEFFIIFWYFFAINWIIGLAGVFASSIVFAVFYFSSGKIERLTRKRAMELDKKSGILYEVLRCIKEIKTYNIFPFVKERAEGATRDYLDALLDQRVVEEGFRVGVVLFIELFRLVLLIYGVGLISVGKMDIGVLLVIYNYYAQLIDSFSDFANINNNLRNLKVSKNRFHKILEFSADPADKDSEAPELVGNIEFKDILYGFRENPVLAGVSFNIKANSITCVAGPAGSGKSGIIDLIMKLNRPHEGEVLIDNTNIADFQTREYYNLVSAASKDPVFFNVSLKENMSFVEEDFDKIIEVCKKLNIHEYILKLKEGYFTVLKTDGSNIDPNIRQLLGVARVLVREPKIMLFDEVFYVLDSETIGNIMTMLDSMKASHTIVIVTKSINILSRADNIILMEKGRVKKTGTHKELMESEKLYRDLLA